MKPKAAPNPRIPGTTADRTASAGILRRALAALRARFAGLERDALAIFGRIRILATNEVATRTLYALTPQEMAAVTAALQDALDRWIVNARDPAHTFWWSAYDEDATRMGTAQSVANLQHLSPAYAAATTLQQVVFSEPYRTRVAFAQLKSYDHWTKTSAAMRSDLVQIITRAVVDGKNPRAVRSEIRATLGVSKSRAEGFAQTDITDTLRQARWAEADAAQEQFGLQIGLLWTSALLATTRPTHARRNGWVYTSDECRAFYAVDGNRYRCHCAQTEALLDTDGRPILSRALKGSMAAELKTWQQVNDAL